MKLASITKNTAVALMALSFTTAGLAGPKSYVDDNLDYIDRHRGRFVTVLPRTRLEDGEFRKWIQKHTPAWEKPTGGSIRLLGNPVGLRRRCPAAYMQPSLTAGSRACT